MNYTKNTRKLKVNNGDRVTKKFQKNLERLKTPLYTNPTPWGDRGGSATP